MENDDCSIKFELYHYFIIDRIIVVNEEHLATPEPTPTPLALSLSGFRGQGLQRGGGALTHQGQNKLHQKSSLNEVL